jgi:charged multivesicular body protein 1
MGNGNSQKQMYDTMFNLKFTSKQFDKEARKCEKKQAAAQKQVAACIKAGDMERAKIYAQNAIRHKNQSLNFLKLSARMDAVRSRIDMALKQQQVTKQMSSVTVGMGAALKSMNPAKVAMVMDKFETTVENLDVRSAVMEQSMDTTTASMVGHDEVEALIAQTADAHGLEVMSQLDAAGAVGTSTVADAAEAAHIAASEERLRRLRNAPQAAAI